VNEGIPKHPGDGRGGFWGVALVLTQFLLFLGALAGTFGFPFLAIREIWRQGHFTTDSFAMLLAFLVSLIAFFGLKARLGDYSESPRITDGWWDKARLDDRKRQGVKATFHEEKAAIASIPDRKIRSIPDHDISSIKG
jgi:hypothetical protein